jgi:hypothetical protein
VVDESEGALGDVDCCFEQATIASALRHNKRRLRFIRSPHCISVYRPGGARRPPAHCRHPVEHNAWTQAAFRRSIPQSR